MDGSDLQVDHRDSSGENGLNLPTQQEEHGVGEVSAHLSYCLLEGACLFFNAEVRGRRCLGLCLWVARAMVALPGPPRRGLSEQSEGFPGEMTVRQCPVTGCSACAGDACLSSWAHTGIAFICLFFDDTIQCAWPGAYLNSIRERVVDDNA